MPTRVRLSLALTVVLLAGPQLHPAAQGNRTAVPQTPDDRTIIHVLNRLGFGPTRAAIDRVCSMGLEAYIEEQLHPERFGARPRGPHAGRRHSDDVRVRARRDRERQPRTDAGHGNAMMILGGAVRGGKIYERWPRLALEQRHEGRDLAITTDFRAVFNEGVQTQPRPAAHAARLPGLHGVRNARAL